MPGETKIFKNSNGWYNVEAPTVFHATREIARSVRKQTITGGSTVPKPTTNVIVQNIAVPPAITTFTSLQQRLYDRLVNRQGVSTDDAEAVVSNEGYNKAASYGHMREAGANHSEALSVIFLDSPDLSLAYGRARVAGYNHTGALAKAIREVNGADSDD